MKLSFLREENKISSHCDSPKYAQIKLFSLYRRTRLPIPLQDSYFSRQQIAKRGANNDFYDVFFGDLLPGKVRVLQRNW